MSYGCPLTMFMPRGAPLLMPIIPLCYPKNCTAATNAALSSVTAPPHPMYLAFMQCMTK